MFIKNKNLLNLLMISMLIFGFFLTGAAFPVAAQTNSNVEDQYWEAVKNSTNAEDFKSYLKEYPTGKYAAIARQKINPQASSTNNPQSSANQTDAEFLNNWAAQVRVGLPESVGGFQLTNAWSRCPAGCQEKDSPAYLLLKFDAEAEQQYADITDLEKDLKPILLTEYCKSDAIRRNIALGVFFDHRAQGQKVNFWVEPNECSSNSSASINLALGKTATQSNDMGSPFKATEGAASKAVDGNTDGNFANGSVTHTACGVNAANECLGSKNPWWKVDLGAEYEISKIEIWNRTDCCRERLTNFKVWVSAANGDWTEFSNGAHIYNPAEQYPLTFTNKKKARYVVVLMDTPNGILSLTEVKVFGTN